MTMHVRVGLAAVLAAVSIASTSGQQGPQIPAHVAGDLIVKFRGRAAASDKEALLAPFAATLVRRFDALGIDVARLAAGRDLAAVIEALSRHPNIEFVQPNYIRSVTQGPPNDPFWLDGTSLWGLRKIQAPEAWNSFTHGNGSVVLVSIDTGVNYAHPDLAANMWRNPDEIAGNGIDDDLNGYIDDVHGINAIGASANHASPLDDHGHGTHTAGTIAAVGNNGVGVVGVNWDAKILACKFLNSAGFGNDQDAIECFNYAVALKNRGINIRVTNNSWGSPRGTAPPAPALQAAFDAAGAVGIINVVAAGNSAGNNDLSPFDPASFDSPSIVAVAGSDANDARYGSSNFGATSVDLAAPGVGILSTIGSGYGSLNGTSMAAPHVAGAAALLLSLNPALSVADVKGTLISSVDVLPNWSGVVLSNGRLNVFRAASAYGPTVTLTSPAAGASFSAPAQMALEATATAGQGSVTSVEFRQNGTSLFTDTTAPYAYTWTNVAAGAYELTAVVRNSAGSTATSQTVNVTVGPGSTASGQSLHTAQVPAGQGFAGAYDLGVRFRSSVAGSITALRFFKGTGETTGHVGRLWTATGQLLATVTFTTQTTSGWQEQALATPVAIQPNVDYVAAVSTGSGARYVATVGFFNVPLTNGELHAPVGNGVYGSVGTFPTATYSNTNYFRDVVFVSSGAPSDTTLPTVTLTEPVAGATVSGTTAVRATASDNVGVAGVQFQVDGVNVGSEDTSAPYEVNWDTTTVSSGPHSVRAVARDAAGNVANATISVTVSNGAPPSGLTLHTSQVPAGQGFAGAYDLGVRFRSSVAGSITALRFFKGTGETTGHVGRLWTATGQLLATVTFSTQTASGWQEQALAAPVAIQANVDYVASVSTGSASRYVATVGFFNSALTNGELHAAAGNGVYGSVGTFPTATYSNTNYFRDVVFVSSGAPSDTTLPTVTLTEPAAGATVSGTTTVRATASDNVGVAGVQFQVDGVNVGSEDTSAPYEVNWNTTTVSNGPHSVRAVARDAAGNTANATISVTVSNSVSSGQSLFTTQTPAGQGFAGSYELGTRFVADVPGTITAVRFWKSPGESASHVGRIWTAAGALLATVTFVNETASGWQQQALASPLAISAGTPYVVSVSSGGSYVATVGFFAAPLVNGHLTAPSGANGLYGSPGTFPTLTYSSTSYFRDVVFVPATSPAPATEWYVAPGGSGDGTAASPFGRIQDGIDAAQPGHVVRVLPGTYAETLRSARHGASGAPITVRAEAGRGSVVVSVSGRVLDISHTFVVVDSLVFDGQYGPSVTAVIRSTAHDAVLRNVEVRRSGRDAVDVGGAHRVLIENSLVHHALNPTGGRTDAHGIVAGPVRDLRIRNTEIHTFSGDGIQLDPGRSAPGWSGVTIEDSRIWLAPLPAAENGFAAGTVPGENGVDTKSGGGFPRAALTIRNTTFSGFRSGLIGNMAALNLKENVDAIVDAVTIFDSEIAFRLRGPGPNGGAWVTATNAVVYDVLTAYRYEDNIEQLRIWNSTIGAGVTNPFQAASSNALGLNVRNVLVLGSRPAEALDPSNLVALPSWFTSAATHDYRLAPAALAIDAGVTLAGVTHDRLGVARPQGVAYDVGAHERHGQ